MPRLSLHSVRAATVAVVITSVLAVSAASADEATAESAEGGETDTLYSLGVVISGQLAGFDLSQEEVGQVVKGIQDGLAGKAKVDPQEVMPKIQALAAERGKRLAEVEHKASAEFLKTKTAAAKAKGGEVTASGLVYTELKAGDGASPTASDQVKVHYHGTLRTGEVFDSSVERGEPVTFGLDQVIPCWTEGVQKMKVGGKSELVCPADLAYGDRAAGPIPPGSTLVFEVELLEIVE